MSPLDPDYEHLLASLDDVERDHAVRVLAERDQALQEVRCCAQVVSAYLEGLENENVPDPLRTHLVRDFAGEYWRQNWMRVVDGEPNGDATPIHD